MTAPHGQDFRALLAHARHELRTPVNGILGYSEMLLEDASDLDLPAFTAALHEVHDLGKELLEGINRLLDGRRAEEPGQGADKLATEVREVLQVPCQQALACCTSLREQAAAPPLAALTPDVERIATAVLRLRVLLDDPFAEGPAPAVPAPTAASLPVPREVSEDTASWLEEGRHPSGGRPGHVLVVDDNTQNRDMLGRALHRQGHYFALAENGRQALDLLTSGAFDVVLLDILMPEMDGFETLAQVKADPHIGHVPVIMISALDEIASVVRCIEMGAEDYLPKPFDPVLLRARLGACLEKKRLRDQELEYLRNVAAVTEAAVAVEAGRFDADTLKTVAERSDALGQLARVFQSMAREVRVREERLQQQVQQLRVEIDERRKARQVAEITETGYFQELQQKVHALRNRAAKKQE